MLRCLTSAEDRTAQYSFRLYFSFRQYSSLGYLQPFVRQWLTSRRACACMPSQTLERSASTRIPLLVNAFASRPGDAFELRRRSRRGPGCSSSSSRTTLQGDVAGTLN